MSGKDSDVQIFRTTVWSGGPGCHGGCGVLAHVKKGKLVKIEGDPDHPWNQGRLCVRGLAMTQIIDHPDRIRYPMKRVGERGEDKWKRISWEEAFDTIETKMKALRDEFGPESGVFIMGTGRDIGAWICMLAYAYGSPNVAFGLSGNACYGPRVSACATFQGDYSVFDAGQWLPKRYEDPRFKLPETIMVWGYNIGACCPDNLFGHWIIDMMKKGTKIISVDPRFTWFASRAEHWLQLRPGSEAALAMGFLNVVINENLYDKEFVEKWTNAPHLIREDTNKILRESHLIKDGSDVNFVVWDEAAKATAVWNTTEMAFADSVKPALSGRFKVTLADGKKVWCRTAWDALLKEVEKYPLDEVEKITWVKADDIRKAARLYANSKPASIQWGEAIDMSPNVTPTAHALLILWNITGNNDVPGGNVIARYAYDVVAYALPGAKGVIKLKDQELDEPRIGADRYGVFKNFYWRAQTDVTLEQIFTEKPYPIKSLWIQAANPLGALGMDLKQWREALKKVDFVVHTDLFMTATSQLADIVLPAATFLEKDSVRSWWVPLQTMKKIVTVDECKPDPEINFELAKRFDPDFQYKDLNEILDAIVEPSGMTFKQLQDQVYSYPPEGHPSHPYRRYEKGLLRKDKKQGFQTPSGKVELYSVHRENWGMEALPLHEEPPFSPIRRPDLFKEYPLLLNTGRRSPAFFNSEHRQIPWLRALDPDPTLEIHPETAANLNIGNGEWVIVENWMGKVRYKAKATKAVPRWMVMAAHGWWFPERNGKDPELYGIFESNVNHITPMGYQGKDGLGAPIKNLLCKVYKEASAQEPLWVPGDMEKKKPAARQAQAKKKKGEHHNG